MLYAQFYNKAVYPIGSDNLIESCGDRAVIIYDARVRLSDIMADARKECIKRGYNAFAMFKGETFTRSNRISEIIRIGE